MSENAALALPCLICFLTDSTWQAVAIASTDAMQLRTSEIVSSIDFHSLDEIPVALAVKIDGGMLAYYMDRLVIDSVFGKKRC